MLSWTTLSKSGRLHSGTKGSACIRLLYMSMNPTMAHLIRFASARRVRNDTIASPYARTHSGWQERRVVVTKLAILFFKDGSRHVIDHIPLIEIEHIQLGTAEVCPPVPA